MGVMKIENILRELVIEYGLVASEHEKDKDYIDNMLIDTEDMRSILDDAKLSVYILLGLTEYNSFGSWNELRYGNTILDSDLVDSMTFKEWVKYLKRHNDYRKRERERIKKFIDIKLSELSHATGKGHWDKHYLEAVEEVRKEMINFYMKLIK